MTERLYLTSGELSVEARVVDVGMDDDGHWARLTQTVFHPQGGGQRCDVGTINGAPVLRVVADGESIKHYLSPGAELRIGDSVALSVDPEARRRNAWLHTGGHLVAAVLQAIEPQVIALSGHHWPAEARVEFDAPTLTGVEGLQQRLQTALDRAIDDGLPVTVGSATGWREVAIGEFSGVPCGGTHLASTAELAGLFVVSVKLKDGRLRVRYDIRRS